MVYERNDEETNAYPFPLEIPRILFREIGSFSGVI